MKRHLVLVGLPGSGKSTVGPLVGAALGVRFVDVDRVIEATTGESVAELFARRGEAAFRELEREAMEVELSREPAVLAPGGGWAAQPGNLDAALPRARLVYLAVSPEAAAARLAGQSDRPLLLGGEPRQVLERLIVAREPFYRRASIEVDAEAGPAELVAAGIVAAARREGV